MSRTSDTPALTSPVRAASQRVIPPSPPGARIRLSADATTQTTIFRWKAVGGPGITILLLIMLSPFAILSLVMSAFALTSSGPHSAASAAGSGPVVFLVVLTSFIWLLVYAVLEAQMFWRQTLTITPEHVIARLEGGLLGNLIGSLRRWQEPRESIRSVRIHDEDAIEFSGKGPTRRALIHLPAPGEPEWLVEAVRAIIAR